MLKTPITGATIANPAMRYAVKPEDAARLQVYVPTLTDRTGLLVQVAPVGGAGANQINPLVGEGSAWVYATVNAYGTVLQDSVLYTFSYPYVATIATNKLALAVTNSFNGRILTLAPGATVTFSSSITSTDPLTVAYTFDNPAAATTTTPPSTTGGASGNITALTGGQTSKRQFMTVGTYHWTGIATGGPAPWTGQSVSGTIVVK